MWFRNFCEDLDKIQDFDNKYQVSRLYNKETIHQVEVFSFLYKREMHWVINKNTKEARMKDLDKLGSKVLDKWSKFGRFLFFKKAHPNHVFNPRFLYF